MEFRLDGNHAVPVYRQIVNQVKHQVAVGALMPGERLPTVRQLAEELEINPNTVVRAYRLLDRDGVISLQHGRGTFVRAHASQPHLVRHRQERLGLLIGEAIAQALSLGYAPPEIQQTFAKRMAEWKRARSAPRSGKRTPRAERVDGAGKK